jgi:hypothetical protein
VAASWASAAAEYTASITEPCWRPSPGNLAILAAYPPLHRTAPRHAEKQDLDLNLEPAEVRRAQGGGGADIGHIGYDDNAASGVPQRAAY